jgi:hypothetical protein
MHLQAADDLKADAERVKAEACARRLEKEGKGGDEDEDVSSAKNFSFEYLSPTFMLTHPLYSTPRRRETASSLPRSSVKVGCQRSLGLTPASLSSMPVKFLPILIPPTFSPSKLLSCLTARPAR